MTTPTRPGTHIVSTDGGPVTISIGPYPGVAMLIVHPDGTITNGAGVAIGGSGGVTSLNTLIGALTLAAGSNITLTPVGSTITIAASGGASGVTSLNTLLGALTIAAGSGITVTPSGGDTLTIASSGGSGDFKADGSVPATGDFDMAQNGIIGVEYIALTGTDPAYTSTFIEVNDQYNLVVGFDVRVPSNIAAIENTYIGSEAGHGHGANPQKGCTGIGANALEGNTFGDDCTMVGRSAMVAGSGPRNTGIGARSFGDSGLNNVSGFDNSGIGYHCFPDLLSGAHNVAAGKDAGGGVTTGGKNIFIGEASATTGPTISNQIAIGYGATTAAAGDIAIGAFGSSLSGLIGGNGVPVNASHPDGTFYFRFDGTVGSNIYKAVAGVWAAIL